MRRVNGEIAQQAGNFAAKSGRGVARAACQSAGSGPWNGHTGCEAAEGANERTVAPPESRIRVVRPAIGLGRDAYLVGGGIRTGSPTRSRVSGYWGFSR